MPALYRFAAFISYSSRDAAFARRVHRALETYRIPTALGAFDLVGAGGKASRNRVFPVFRDREELPSGELAAAIGAALEASGALIVVCSPHAAASPWVNKEIESFIALGRRDRIFAIIADDAPVSDENGADATAACFPPAFRGDGLGAGFEPLAADARKGKDTFRGAWLKLVAGLIGVNAGALADRDRARRRTQAARLVLAAGASVGALAYAAAWTGALNARERLANIPAEAAALGVRVDPAPFSVAAAGEAGSARPTFSALALRELREFAGLAVTRDLGTLDARDGLALDPTGAAFATWDLKGRVRLYRTDPKAPVADLGVYGAPEMFDALNFADDGKSLLVRTDSFVDGRADLYRVDGAAPVAKLRLSGVASAALGSDGAYLMTRSGRDGMRIYRISEAGGVLVGESHDRSRFAHWAKDGRRLVVMGQGQNVQVYRFEGPAPTSATPVRTSIDPMALRLVGGGDFLLANPTDAPAFLYDLRRPAPSFGLGEVTTVSEGAHGVLAVSKPLGAAALVTLYPKPSAVDLPDAQEMFFSGDGEKLFFKTDDGAFVRIDLLQPTPRPTLLKGVAFDRRPAVSRSGDAIAGHDKDGRTRVYRLSPAGDVAGVVDLGDFGDLGDLARVTLAGHWAVIERRRASTLALDVAAPRRVHDLGFLSAVHLTETGVLVTLGAGETSRQFDLNAAPLDAATAPALARVACDRQGALTRPFAAALRGDGKTDAQTERVRAGLGEALKGRPWNPCDWRGLFAVFPNAKRGDGWFEGLKQWSRRFEVVTLHRAGRDYACAETTSAASPALKAGRAAMCAAMAE